MNYPYPGYVRELENLIERYCLLGTRVNDLLHNQPNEYRSVSSDFPYDELLSSSNPLKMVAQRAKHKPRGNLLIMFLKFVITIILKLQECLTSVFLLFTGN